MDKRIRFILHQKKQILLVDFSACSPLEVEAIGRAIPEYVSVQPRASVLLLADFTGASFSSEALRVLKESAVFNKPYIKKSAWVGAETFPPAFLQDLGEFSRRELPTFKSREKALLWLIQE